MTAGVEGDAGHDDGHADERHQMREVLIGNMAGVSGDGRDRLHEDGRRQGDNHQRQPEMDEAGHAFELVQPFPRPIYHEHTLVIHRWPVIRQLLRE